MGLRERVQKYTILSDCDGVHVRSVKPFTEAMNLELRKLGFIGDYEPEDNLYFEWAYDEALRVSDNVSTAKSIRAFWYDPVVLALSPAFGRGPRYSPGNPLSAEINRPQPPKFPLVQVATTIFLWSLVESCETDQ